jgi:hypothetical protein
MQDEAQPGKSPAPYLIGGVLILLIVVGVGYFMNKKSEASTSFEETREAPQKQVAGASTVNGQKFSDSQYAGSAVQIAPGALSPEAQAVTTGWQIKSRSLADGSTQVNLIPTGSETTEGDSSHTFNLKSGDKLYFVDLTPGDDRGGSDGNKNDDIGIVVNSDGIIQ